MLEQSTAVKHAASELVPLPLCLDSPWSGSRLRLVSLTPCPLCVLSWSLSGSEQFALRYADGPQLYITEQVSCRVAVVQTTEPRLGVKHRATILPFVSLQSRGDIKNGTILRLAISPVSPRCLSTFNVSSLFHAITRRCAHSSLITM